VLFGGQGVVWPLLAYALLVVCVLPLLLARWRLSRRLKSDRTRSREMQRARPLLAALMP
jgi:membrane-anchored protein YejM (alkaline phosphatase superfamily)